jgi:spore coat polysaccharide biosynthesis protein SpsF
VPRVGITIEARMTSTRLPGKVLLPVLGRPMLAMMVERVRRVPGVDAIVIATTVNASDDPIAELAARLGVGCHRGSEEDVLQRVLDAARAHDLDVIVELTGDCPLIDPAVIASVIATYRTAGVDYVSNCLDSRTFPLGMETQVFATDILADVARRTDDAGDREHVSLYIYRHPELYSLQNHPAPAPLADGARLTLDTPADYELIRRVFEALYPTKPDFDLAAILALFRRQPELRALNAGVAQKHA